MLTTEAMICEVPDRSETGAGHGGGGGQMPGMDY